MSQRFSNPSAADRESRRHSNRHKLAQATRHGIEALEKRWLLSGTDLTAAQSAILAAVPPGTNGQFVGSQLDLTPAPAADGATPDYMVLDSNPSLTDTGALAPYASSTPVGLSPVRLRHAYGVDNITFGSVTGDGTGQTIAIIDAYDDPTASVDLHAFDLQFGLADPPSFTKVNETGGSTLPGTDPSPRGNDWELEESLDIEWAHAAAPGASLILVEATSATDADLITNAVNWARSAPGVSAVSMSFGRGENSSDASLDPTFTTPAGHAGVTFLASTGDSGSPGGFPAYSPNVVAVGGTTLNTDTSGNLLAETGWSGSGGGISAYESQPAYQQGVVTQSSTRRTIPDVASDADPNTGVAVYDTYDFGTTSPWIQVGGTSLSSPTWAGLIAIADQGRTLGGAASLDGPTQTLPRLYGLQAADFHDITSGSNGGFAAGAGYDLVTGRGSPVASALLPALAASGPYVTGFTPTGLQSTAPSHVDFTFSTPMDPTSFSVASDVDAFTGPGSTDLRSSISGFSWLNNNTTLEIDFTAPTAQGPYTMTVGPQILSAGGKAMDQNQNGIVGEAPADQYAGTFYFDSTPTQVTSTDPPAGSTLKTPFTTLDLHLSAAYDPTTISPKNLTISEGSITGATAVNATTVEYSLSGVYGGTINVTMPQGALTDANGNPVLAFNASYTVPNTNPPSTGWTTYQGDDGHTGYVNGSQNPAYEQTLWSTKLPSGSLTDMSVGGGGVYVTADYASQVFGLNAATGAINWQKALGSQGSTNAPAFDNGNVFVQTDDEVNGTYLWSFNAATGAQNFKTPLNAQWETYLSPTIAYGNVYMDGGTYGGMYSVSESTGAQNWFGFVPQYDEWTPAVTSAYCYTFTGSGSTTPITGKFTILNRLTGATVSVTTDTGFYWNGYSMNEAVALGGNNDAFATNGNRLLSFSTQPTGGINWVVTDKFTGQVTVANGVLYVQDGSGIAALSESTGATLWTWTPANDTLSGRIIATDNMLYTSSANATYAISLKTQQTAWTVPHGGHLALDHNTLYIAGSDGTMTAIGLHKLAAGPVVTSFAPTGLQTTAPTSIDFNFDSPMDPTSFSVASDVDAFTGPGNTDLTSSITGFSWLNNNTTLEVDFTAPTAAGPYTMAVGPQILSATGAAMDQNQNGVAGETPGDQFSGTFYFDTAPIQVTSTTPAVGSTVTPPFTTIDVHFSKGYDPTTISPSNLVLSQGKVTAATAIDATTVRYTLSGITAVGAFTISMPEGAIVDTNGVPNLAYSGTYTIAPPDAPTGAPLLAAASDTGISSSDGITSLDNSSSTKTLQFTVAGTFPGYLVSIYADGIFIGSAVAPASSSTTTTTTVVTNGLTALSYGLHSITARQGPTGGQSGDSPASSIRVLNVAPTLPAPGGYDWTFNYTGTRLDSTLVGNGAMAEAIQQDGKILVAGAAHTPGRTTTSAAVARYTPDGQLDPTFGANGYVVTPISPGDQVGRSIALQSDGRIVVLVTGASSSTSSVLELVRYNADGSLDPTFGSGGIAMLPGAGGVVASQVVVEPDGKLLVAASNTQVGKLVRVNSDGTLDTTFNGQGYVTAGFGGLGSAFNAVAATSDGHILVCGDLCPDGYYNAIVARYTASGAPDTSFNGTGYVMTRVGTGFSNGTGMIVQPDGKILVSAVTTYGLALLRYNPDSTLDSTFGTGGIVTMAGLGVSAPVLQGDGRIVVAGTYNSSEGFIDRFNANGTWDASFGSAGQLLTQVGAASASSYFDAVAVQGDGRIVAAGLAHDPANTTKTDLALTRVFGASASLALDPASDSGISNSDLITNNTTPTFNVASLGGLYTRIYRNGVLASTVPYNTAGTITLPAQPAGTNTYQLKVVDLAGNESLAGPAYVVKIDLTPPVASMLTGPAISSSATVYTFNVTYTDANGVLGSSIGTGNILVSGGNGSSQLATMVSASPSSPTATSYVVTYQITVPSGGWGPAATNYTFRLQPNSVLDVAGNASASAIIGTTQVIAVDPPGQPQLEPAADSGASNADDVTNLYNGSAATVLQFLVPNTAPGATVTLYADGQVIGTAVAPSNATSTLVTTNGTLALANGTHSITARQTVSGVQTVDSSPPLTITVETTVPVAALASPLIAVGANYQFTIRYTDVTGVNAATIGDNNLLVTSSAGYNLAASLVSVSSAANGTPILATYQIAPPSVGWTAAGWTYTVKMQPMQVANIAGNFALTIPFATLSRLGAPAPNTPVLAAASDSGSSSSDDITSFNNSSPAKALTFTMTGTAAGDAVTLYADNVLIGSTVATSSTTTITTDGSTTLADGAHTIVAKRTPLGGTTSGGSNIMFVKIDTVALAPWEPVLDPSTDSGASNQDAITNVPAPTIDVTTREAGTVYVQFDGPNGPVVSKPSAGFNTIPGLTPAGFQPESMLSTGQGLFRVATRDFNGDGKQDLVIQGTSSMQFLAGNGDGTFAPASTIANTAGAIDFLVGDFNGDGKPDLFVRTSDNIEILLGTGTASPVFQPPVTFASSIGNTPEAADFNGDGKLDFIAKTQYSDGNLNIFPGNGDGTFQPPLTANDGLSLTTNYTIADVNGDGKPDIVATDGNQTISVLLNDGNGTFAAAVLTTRVMNGPWLLNAADFNGDGKADLLVGDGLRIDQLLVSNGDGTFKAPVTMTSDNNPYFVAAADLNGDGKMDAIVGANSVLYVAYGNGDGTLQPAVAFPLKINPLGIAVGDFNGDGKLDVAMPHDLNDNNLSILLGTGGALRAGTHTVTAWEIDVAGNVSAVTAPNTITIDQTPPTASNLIGPPATTAAAAPHTFTVNYRDDVGMNAASLDNNDILVTGPNGYSQLATFVSVVQGSAKGSIFATYQLVPPAGGWSAAANGTYTVTLQASQVSDTAGNFAAAGPIGTFAISVAASTAQPQLLAVSDSGVSDADGVTSFNNAAPAAALQFTVGNTIAGAVVTIYADGVAIGSATASGATVTIVTDGATALADGTRSITARQTVSGTGQSADSAPMMLTVDTTPPTVQLSGAATGATPVDRVSITFSEPAYGLTLADLQLTSGGTAVPWTAAQTLTTADHVTWTLAGLASLTSTPGNYQLVLTPAPAVTDLAGNALATGASAAWTELAATNTTLNGQSSNPTDVTQASTFTVTVSGGVPDSESVKLVDTSNNNAVVATGTLTGGSATLTIPAGTLSAGTHNLVALYGGDATLAASRSAALAQSVQAVVTSVVVNGDNTALAGVQRSMVNGIVYTFSQPVTLASTGAFTIAVHAGQTGTLPTLTWTPINPDVNGASAQWVVTFGGAGVANGSIANGVYDITLAPTAVTVAGTPSATLAPRPTDTFYRLYGDAFGTGNVTALDYNLFKQSLTTFNPIFDNYGTGTSTALDYNLFKKDLSINYAGDGFVTTI